MKHRDRPPEQDDLLRPRLVDLIDMRHELVKLAALIDWEFFEREWAGFFPSGTGRPATPPRLVTGLMYLQHLHRLSDEKPLAATWGRDTAFTSRSSPCSNLTAIAASLPHRIATKDPTYLIYGEDMLWK